MCRVLNTDNMSIIGVTIDYGPFGFVDRYDPGHVCNASGEATDFMHMHALKICINMYASFIFQTMVVVMLTTVSPLCVVGT